MKRSVCLLSLTLLLASPAIVLAQSNTFPSSGNVGIGTTSPAYSLTISGSGTVMGIDNNADFEAKNSSGIYEDYFWPRSHANETYLNYGTGGFNIRNDASVSTIYLTNSGLVGIGTTSPSSLLTLNTGNRRNGILLTSGYSTTGGLSDIVLNKSSTSGMTSGHADEWDMSLRNDGYFSGSQQNTGVSLEIYAPIYGGGYYAPLSFASNGNLVLVSNQNATSGNVLIGETTQTNTSYKLDVNGNIRADKLVVNTTGADYVFDPGYHLSPLDSLNKYIQLNHHLPDIESARQMQQQGMDVGETQKELLQKVEELTLYVIRLNKQVQLQNNQLKMQDVKIAKLEKGIATQTQK
jgi:hypothetical protein